MRNLLLASSCLLAAASASAQTAVSASAGRASNVVAPIVPFSPVTGAASLVSPLSSIGLTPTLSAPSISPSAVRAEIVPSAAAGVAPAVAAAQAAALPAAAVPAAAAAVAAEAKTAAPALQVLSAASVADEKTASVKLDETFDGAVARKPAEDDGVSVPAAKPSRSFLSRAAGMMIAAPAMAIGQLTIHTPIAEPLGAMDLVLNYGPMATAIAAILGALFGLWSARSKDGSPANAGQVLSASLSYGAIAGAAAFTLLDLTKVAFLGASAAALTPITAAVATAALAQTAFAAKFTDPATTPADRIIGAFPAVAATFGLGIGAIAFAAPAGLLAAATWAMMATGAATALYTALFRLEKSAAAGPAAMGRGIVLQTLMSGLAFSLGPSPYALFFLALSAWGFVTVMRTTAAEFWSATEGVRARFGKKP